MKTKSTKSAAALKPYKGFPLTAHRAANQWCKKHRGKIHYLGPLDNWQAALKRFEREWPYIIQGLTPPALADDADACTLRSLCNLFLESKRNKIAAGELTELSYRDYFRAANDSLTTSGPIVASMIFGPWTSRHSAPSWRSDWELLHSATK